MREDILTQFQRDGYVVLEDFLTEEETNELKTAGEELAAEIPKENRKAVFSTTQIQQGKDNYFLESGDKISYFYEAGAIGEDGEFLVPKEKSLNKVGHALHYLHPSFYNITFSEKVKETCFRLGMQEPLVVQSMYIYKNPGIGSEVKPHQDASYLFTEPNSLIGFWIALDDATPQNGCLSFVPGSHCSGVHRKFIRNPDKNSEELLIYDTPAPIYPSSSFQLVPVKKGSCIVIHGQVVHKSDKNRSPTSRHAYTFHVMEHESKYSPDNWLQSEKGENMMAENHEQPSSFVSFCEKVWQKHLK
ncbi:phytanoyl-CoA dioxygenase domain containing 1 isoform X2 [Lycorma delicatula]|uniref:phytanoyl-CoA dioxygenase domain containing 1 isoform X2 n=1 Tax=Lycorma delicatula TaxID=130591 RepID=UPI003F518F0D